MVPVDGVTDTTVGRLAAPVAAGGSGGGGKPPALPRLRGLQALASPPTVVTVRQALGISAWSGAEVALLPPLLCSAPLVTTASAPVRVHASASAADCGCAAAAAPGLDASGRQQSSEACMK